MPTLRNPRVTAALAAVLALGLAAPAAAIMVPISIPFGVDPDVDELDVSVRKRRADPQVQWQCQASARQFLPRNTLSPSRRAAVVRSCLEPAEPPEADFGV